MCSFICTLDAILYGVESLEGHSKGLVGGFVVHVGETELIDRLFRKYTDTSLEGLSEHEFIAERFLDVLVVELLLGVRVLVGLGSLILRSLVRDLSVLELSIVDVFSSLTSGELITLSLRVVFKIVLLFLHSVFVRSFILECGQISLRFLSLF